MVPEQNLAPVTSTADEHKEMSAVDVKLPLVAYERPQPIVATSQIDLARRQIDTNARGQCQHVRVSRSATASRATYAGSAPIGTRTRTPATLTSTCVATEGDGLTVTRTRRTSGMGTLDFTFATSRSRRSLYSQYWKIAKPTPASAEKSLRDLPLPSNRATNSVQNRRRSARCFMRASFPHRRPPPKGAPSRTVTSR